jgi:hypothetical protein
MPRPHNETAASVAALKNNRLSTCTFASAKNHYMNTAPKTHIATETRFFGFTIWPLTIGN